MNRVYEGLLIIGKYEPDSNICAEHDQIWFGQYPETKEQMLPQEVVRLEELGWFEDEDSWSVHT